VVGTEGGHAKGVRVGAGESSDGVLIADLGPHGGGRLGGTISDGVEETNAVNVGLGIGGIRDITVGTGSGIGDTNSDAARGLGSASGDGVDETHQHSTLRHLQKHNKCKHDSYTTHWILLT